MYAKVATKALVSRDIKFRVTEANRTFKILRFKQGLLFSATYALCANFTLDSSP